MIYTGSNWKMLEEGKSGPISCMMRGFSKSLHTGRFGNLVWSEHGHYFEICSKLALLFMRARGVRWRCGTPCTPNRWADRTRWKMGHTSLERLSVRNWQGGGFLIGKFAGTHLGTNFSRQMWQLCHSQCNNWRWWQRLLHSVCLLWKPLRASILMLRF